MNGSFTSDHFTVEQIADGVYAIISKRDEGMEFVNAGMVDMGEGVLIFDSLSLPQSARDLLRAADEVIGKPVRWMINSHYHGDHITGNFLLPPDIPIISTHTTYELLVTSDWEADLAEGNQHLLDFVEQLEQQLEAAEDDQQKATISTRLKYYGLVVAGFDDEEARLPTITFDDQITIQGAARSAHLITYGGGHTKSDAFLYLPDEKILFAGDLALVETHPFMLDGDPEQWPIILEQMKHLDFDKLVPGHGPIGDAEDIDAMLVYFEAVDEMVKQAMVAGKSADEIKAMPAPPAYADWFGGALPHNLQFLYKQHGGQSDEA